MRFQRGIHKTYASSAPRYPFGYRGAACWGLPKPRTGRFRVLSNTPFGVAFSLPPVAGLPHIRAAKKRRETRRSDVDRNRFFNGSGLEERADSDTFFPWENNQQEGGNRAVLIVAWTRFSVGILCLGIPSFFRWHRRLHLRFFPARRLTKFLLFGKIGSRSFAARDSTRRAENTEHVRRRWRCAGGIMKFKENSKFLLHILGGRAMLFMSKKRDKGQCVHAKKQNPGGMRPSGIPCSYSPLPIPAKQPFPPGQIRVVLSHILPPLNDNSEYVIYHYFPGPGRSNVRSFFLAGIHMAFLAVIKSSGPQSRASQMLRTRESVTVSWYLSMFRITFTFTLTFRASCKSVMLRSCITRCMGSKERYTLS